MTIGEVTTVPKIGDRAVLRGHGYVVRGVTPASVMPAVVYLNDVKTGAALEVPLEQLEFPLHDDGLDDRAFSPEF